MKVSPAVTGFTLGSVQEAPCCPRPRDFFRGKVHLPITAMPMAQRRVPLGGDDTAAESVSHLREAAEEVRNITRKSILCIFIFGTI